MIEILYHNMRNVRPSLLKFFTLLTHQLLILVLILLLYLQMMWRMFQKNYKQINKLISLIRAEVTLTHCSVNNQKLFCDLNQHMYANLDSNQFNEATFSRRFCNEILSLKSPAFHNKIISNVNPFKGPQHLVMCLYLQKTAFKKSW